jgi:hypothetical protein
MAQDQLGEIVQAWNDHRPYLVDLAFRMLGASARPKTQSRTRSPGCSGSGPAR